MLPITRKSKRATRKSANKKRAATRKATKKGGACPYMKAGSVQRGG